MTASQVDIVHFALLLRPSDSIASPGRLLRRVPGPAPRDELLGYDAEWHPTDLLVRVERGELPGRLERIGTVGAEVLAEAARQRHGKLVQALDRQARGELALRVGDVRRQPDGRPVRVDPLDPITREAVVSFLRSGPVALTRPPRPD